MHPKHRPSSMTVLVKLVLLVAFAQLVVVAAFVPNGSRSTAYRSVQVTGRGFTIGAAPHSHSTTLHMAVATPEKKKEKKVTDETDSQNDSEKDRGWLVRLYNDPFNKREFVARCLMEVCGLDDGMAFGVMMRAHQIGIGVVGNYHREMAEMYKMRLLEEGLLIDMVPADDEE
ncbi:hypothetical protein ACHAWF_002591 [Thalassiosira exigua]